MGKIQAPKTLRFEDFNPDEKELINKLGDVINSFQDDVYRQLNGNIDFDNLNRQIVENVTIKINSSGVLVNAPQLKVTVKTRVRGLNVVSAINSTNSSTYPTNAPFISYTVNGNILTITNVTGLYDGVTASEWKLNIEVIA